MDRFSEISVMNWLIWRVDKNKKRVYNNLVKGFEKESRIKL